MTNARELPEAVKTAISLLLANGRDTRSYADEWLRKTNDERWKIVEELKTQLGEAGRNASDQQRAVINDMIGQLRQVQNSLK